MQSPKTVVITGASSGIGLECAPFVSGEVLHVDGGAHAGKW